MEFHAYVKTGTVGHIESTVSHQVIEKREDWVALKWVLYVAKIVIF